MTVVDYFNPLDIQHVRAWKTLSEVGAAQKLTDGECKHVFATELKLITILVGWPNGWVSQVAAKMVDQWIEELQHLDLPL